jgi:8-oxo-dGTP pyrophosphatase MutT (NUDIX family)
MVEDDARPERFAGHLFPQVIPEPLDIRPGAPAPWASLPVSQREGLTLKLVETRLSSHGRTFATDQQPEVPAELTIVGDGPATIVTRKSAVLVALFEENQETHVVLTRRSSTLRYHRGEIALPGGGQEGAETPTETALREAREEVGLESSLVRPFAWLSPIVTFASGSSIWPIVGSLTSVPTFRIDPTEVDRVFSVALRDLVADGAFVEERWRRERPRPGGDDDGYFPINFFKVPGDLIWGATARILTELLCLATGVPWPLIAA